jgi:glutamyl-tRNA reductase
MASRAVDRVAAQLEGEGQIAVVGAGEVALDVLATLRARTIARSRVTVVNRSGERASAVARRFGITSSPWSSLPELLATCRVVFCCTSAPSAIVNADMLAPGDAAPVTLVDLGMPRNVSHDTSLHGNVTVINVDDLRGQVMPARLRADDGTNAHLDDAAHKFYLWLQRRRIVPTLQMICSNAEAYRTSELERIRSRLRDLDDQQFAIIESMSRRLVGQLLHRPLATLAASPESDELTRSARRLFDSPT